MPSSAAFDELRTVAVGRLLWKYSFPAVVGMLVMTLYNVFDRIFIGQVVGPDAIAGLAITFPVMNIATALGTLIGVGATACTSLFLGEGRIDMARNTLGNALTMTLAIGVVYISLFAVFMDQVLIVFGANEVTLPYARDFMMYILPGLMLTNITFSLNNIMRAAGYPVRAMVTMFLGAGLNILLAPIFIYVLQLGIKGAAIATDIAMAISAAFVIAHFMKAKNGPIVFSRGVYRPNWPLIWNIIGIGSAPFVVNTGSCLINIFLNRTLLEFGGVAGIAAAGIFVTFSSMLVSIILGICQGMQPIVGFNYGNRQAARVEKVYWLAVGVATIVSFAGFAMARTIPHWIARAFVSDAHLVDFTAKALRLAMTCFWMVGLQVISTTYFQAIGKVGLSIFLSLTRQIIFFLPLLFLLPGYFGLEGVWYTFFTSDILATLVTVVLMIRALKSLRSMEITACCGSSQEIALP